jgi:hypothetical protein
MRQCLLIGKVTLVCLTMLCCQIIVVFDISILRLVRHLLQGGVSLDAMLYMLPSTSSICTVLPLAFVIAEYIMPQDGLVDWATTCGRRTSTLRVPRWKGFGSMVYRQSWQHTAMTNEEILGFVWGMTKIGIIKPGSSRGGTMVSKFLKSMYGQSMLERCSNTRRWVCPYQNLSRTPRWRAYVAGYRHCVGSFFTEAVATHGHSTSQTITLQLP